MYRQSVKKLLNIDTSSTRRRNIYGELRPTNGWDPLASLGHPCKFQRVSRLDSITAQHSSSGREPDFAALNRGHHLYSAARPSRWAFAHILVIIIIIKWRRRNNLRISGTRFCRPDTRPVTQPTVSRHRKQLNVKVLIPTRENHPLSSSLLIRFLEGEGHHCLSAALPT